jgi:hypothetical protein
VSFQGQYAIQVIEEMMATVLECLEEIRQCIARAVLPTGRQKLEELSLGLGKEVGSI